MKLLGRLVFFLIVLGVVFLALANRQTATFSLDPFTPENPVIGFRAPLFVLLMGAVGLGVVLGRLRGFLNGVAKSFGKIFSRNRRNGHQD